MRAAWGLFRAAHPFPSLLVAIVTVAVAAIAGDGERWGTVAVLGAGMLLYQFAIGFANDLADAAADASEKPAKPLPAGMVPRGAVVLACAACAAGGMLITWGLDHGAWYVGVAGLALGLLYDFRLKRTAVSWLPLSLALPLIPAWAFLAFDRWTDRLWWAFPLGALLGLSVHLANQAPDAAGDDGLAGLLGEARARRTAVALFGGAASLGAAVLLLEGEPGYAAVLGAAAVATGLVAARAARFGRDGLFGVLAAGGGLLGLVFVAAL